MRAWIFREAGKHNSFDHIDGLPGLGSCWAIARAVDKAKDLVLNAATKRRIPELALWEDMHMPANANRCEHWWLQKPDAAGGTLRWCDYDSEADELRKVLLLEAALNLEAQGFDEDL